MSCLTSSGSRQPPRRPGWRGDESVFVHSQRSSTSETRTTESSTRIPRLGSKMTRRSFETRSRRYSRRRDGARHKPGPVQGDLPRFGCRGGCVRCYFLPRFAERRFLSSEDLGTLGVSGSLGVRGSSPLSSTISSRGVTERSVAPRLRSAPRWCRGGAVRCRPPPPSPAEPGNRASRGSSTRPRATSWSWAASAAQSTRVSIRCSSPLLRSPDTPGGESIITWVGILVEW